MDIKESDIERQFIQKLEYMKYRYRPDIRDRAALEANFREKFEALNRVQLTDGEFERLLADIVNADVFKASQALRDPGYMEREDGTPLHYSLVNIKDWCKNEFEVVNQLRINTRSSNQRYDVILLINGLPLVQIELKTLGVNPRRAMEQIVRYKNDPGNGYANTLLCFMQLFIVSNRTNTYYFANNPAKHFTFDADEQLVDAGRRDLIEETGYAAGEMRVACVGPVSAGLSSEVLTFCVAGKLERVGEGGGDETENITVHEVPFADIDNWLASRPDKVAIDPKIHIGLRLLEQLRF